MSSTEFLDTRFVGQLRSGVWRALALLCVGAVASAQGGPPLRTDDPWTPGDGHWEINLAATVEELDGRRAIEAPLLDINYGLGERLQLKYEIPWVFVDEPDGEEMNGLGKSMAGVKWRFLDSGLAMSIYPQIEFENHGSSSVDRGIVESGTSILVPVEVAWNLGELGMNFELGREFIDGASDEWLAGLALSRSVSEHVELLAEVHAEASEDWDDSRGVIQAGTRVELAPQCSLLASVGSGAWGTDDDRVDVAAYFGLQLRY